MRHFGLTASLLSMVPLLAIDGWGASPQTVAEGPPLPAVPYYSGSLHVRCHFAQGNSLPKRVLEVRIAQELEKFRKLLEARRSPDDDIEKSLAMRENELTQATRTSVRDLEFWSKGKKWVLTEVDPSIKSDVFTGANAGQKMWVCDGTNLVQVRDNGFSCVLLKPGILTSFFPDIPPVGISDSATPLLSLKLPAEIVTRFNSEAPGWMPVLAPSYCVYSEPAGSANGQVNGIPSRFFNYNIGFYRGESVGGVIHSSEIRISDAKLPIEKWVFDDFRMVSGVRWAFRTMWNNFEPDARGHVTTQEREFRKFEILSLDTAPMNDSVLSIDKYLKPGALVQEEAGHPQILTDPQYPYRKGMSWAEMARQQPQKTAHPVSTTGALNGTPQLDSSSRRFGTK